MTKSNLTKLATVALLASGTLLAACGGGGGGSAVPESITGSSPPPPPPPPPPSESISWTQGVFERSGVFEAKCANPRTGVDIEGRAFPDEAGSLLEELFWLRSWSDESYLWNEEIADQDPAGFSDRLEYFGVLRSEAVTASGRLRDQFHFSEPTNEYLESRLSVPSSGYGLSLVAFSNAPPRDFRIRYTEPNSPASNPVNGQVPFPRGSRILAIDGADLVNGNDVATLNAGLFPANAGEVHEFTVRDVDGTVRTFNITSQDLAISPVNRTEVIDTPSGKVGYILFNTFSPRSSEEAIANAFTELSQEGVSDLVLDLRYNGGGLLAVAGQVGYMVAGPQRTNNRVFDELIINDNPRNPLIGEVGATPFYSTGLGFSLANGTQLNSLNLQRVFILSTRGTCSASEAVINGLRGVDVEVILIGGVTCGKPYGFIPTDNCGETYFTIQFGGINDKGFGEYSDGFLPQNSASNVGVKIPGCVVSDDFSSELGDPGEALLSTALSYRENGTCPSPSVSAPDTPIIVASKPGMTEVATTALSESQERIRNSKDLSMPW